MSSPRNGTSMAAVDRAGRGYVAAGVDLDELVSLTAVAVRTARSAGELLLGLRATHGFADPGLLRAAGDARAHDLIVADLTAARPADVILSEEAADNPARLSARRVWIVDPLDGTREFGQPGRDDWAVHIALWDADLDGLLLGVVGLPALGVVATSTPPATVPPAGAGRPRIAVSRSRPPAQAERAAAALDGELVPLGSAGYKVLAVVTGEVDAYVHSGGQYQWDSAAPIAVARAAGLFTSRLDGSPLRYNGPDLAVPDLIVCRPELAPAILTAVAA